MTCYLLGAKPCPESMLTYYQLDPKDKLHWKYDQNTIVTIQENACENVVCKILAILLRPQCDEY